MDCSDLGRFDAGWILGGDGLGCFSSAELSFFTNFLAFLVVALAFLGTLAFFGTSTFLGALAILGAFAFLGALGFLAASAFLGALAFLGDLAFLGLMAWEAFFALVRVT